MWSRVSASGGCREEERELDNGWQCLGVVTSPIVLLWPICCQHSLLSSGRHSGPVTWSSSHVLASGGCKEEEWVATMDGPKEPKGDITTPRLYQLLWSALSHAAATGWHGGVGVITWPDRSGLKIGRYTDVSFRFVRKKSSQQAGSQVRVKSKFLIWRGVEVGESEHMTMLFPLPCSRFWLKQGSLITWPDWSRLKIGKIYTLIFLFIFTQLGEHRGLGGGDIFKIS